MQTIERYGPWVASVALFVIAAAPRILAIGTYVTVDEQRWIERSIDFVYNLSHGDLATIASVHPGVTATWGFGLFLLLWSLLHGDLSALYQMRADGNYDLLALLPVAAMFTVLATSFTVVIGYWLLRKLFRGKVAFLAALLIAVDPNYLAHSRRVHVDAILGQHHVSLRTGAPGVRRPAQSDATATLSAAVRGFCRPGMADQAAWFVFDPFHSAGARRSPPALDVETAFQCIVALARSQVLCAVGCGGQSGLFRALAIDVDPAW